MEIDGSPDLSNNEEDEEQNSPGNCQISFEVVVLSYFEEGTIDVESENEELAEEDSEVRVCDWKDCGAEISGLKDLVAHVNSKHVQVNYLLSPSFFFTTLPLALCKRRIYLLVEKLSAKTARV